MMYFILGSEIAVSANIKKLKSVERIKESIMLRIRNFLYFPISFQLSITKSNFGWNSSTSQYDTFSSQLGIVWILKGFEFIGYGLKIYIPKFIKFKSDPNLLNTSLRM
ncbi:CLUMA_CG021048, isoform A [Clunio marinus]|uniref:CLUMA_CG021048, isoform A n=1 Tax=Clunio marinus TaxID=568069 RepID=A0A1J1J9C7_9DIPT|nr:CLUMA_CG021048, isoform A [Clunio marinus]